MVPVGRLVDRAPGSDQTEIGTRLGCQTGLDYDGIAAKVTGTFSARAFSARLFSTLAAHRRSPT
jgi:hypothetical protein